ncbi:MAG: fasciclin domain-containing protein [Eudoraea sp.]|uniref:fasciclin domain-containing protein n=1 Tax=Eudoraea sp. TaxID=1979955 RepID=UPI003C74389C
MMKKITTLKRILMFAILSLIVLSCDKNDDGITERTTAKNLVTTAQETDALSSLVAALIKADENEGTDLVTTLSSEGPFTVFAPTNEAFSELLDGLENYDSLEDFDSEEDKELLATILTYHVFAGGAVPSSELSNGQTIATLQGENLEVKLENGVFIKDASGADARVVIPNVAVSNGIVHVVDKVLIPQTVIDAMNDGEDDKEGTLVDLVVKTESLSILEAAVIKAELVETLNSAGPFTVFAPNDDAFVALLEILGDDYNGLDDFDTEAELMLLKDILLYHVIPAEVFAADLAAGNVPTALAENSVEIIALDETFVIGDASDTNANILGADFTSSNGVAHIIDKVLLPQSAIDFVTSLSLKSIVEIAVETDDLSLLVEALQQANAGLVETLSSEGPFTVFAPTNQAFVALLDALGDDYHSLADFDTEEEKALLVQILTYHVVSGTAAFSGDLFDGQEIPTVQGENVGINLKNGTVHIQDATDKNAVVVIPDVEASNGVVHVIDKVLLPQVALDFVASLSLKTIVEIAVETDDLSLLVEALLEANAGLVDVLNSEGPFTVFAPTNEAFVALLDALGDDYHSLADFDTEEEKALLLKVLTYHVVSGTAAFSGDLFDGQEIPTVQGENVGINLKNGTVHIEDATDVNASVVIPDVEASNGVVHVINKVLLPQEVLDILAPKVPNIVELAQSVDELSLLVEALIQADAGLVELLSSDGPFTVFAPTNDAFADLLNALGDDYHSLADFDTEEEKALLTKVLTYHVVAGAAVASGELYNHQELPTAQGESLFAIINHGVDIRDKSGTDANVIAADNIASNGIVHVIDKVLLPQEVINILNPPSH